MKDMKDMKDIIYLIQPPEYNTPIEKFIESFLKENHPTKSLKIKRNYSLKQKPNAKNTYFIINDPQVNSWDGLKIAQKIRSNEPNATLILASTELDYTKFFRSHARFLGVLDLKNTTQSEIDDYLTDSISTSQKTS